MHYQVSLNQNITKDMIDFESMQDPVEIDGHNPEDSLKLNEPKVYSRYMSISPPRDNDANNKSRIGSVKKEKSKDNSVSPCNSIEILDKVLQKRFFFNPAHKIMEKNKISTSSDRRKSVSPYRSVSPICVSSIKNVKNLFFEFSTRFNGIQQTAPRSYTVRRIQGQLKFISTLRKVTFQSQFVKKIIFNVWKSYMKKRIEKRKEL